MLGMLGMRIVEWLFVGREVVAGRVGASGLLGSVAGGSDISGSNAF